jgi:hypothetical protein
MPGGYRILFGDIHNHNALGYGVGSLERSIDVARTHLDFFAFTGHSSWHDMVPMEGGREAHWARGFERLKAGWPTVQRLIADANRDGEFAAFLGFEWHSSRFGDQCVVFPDDHQPIYFADTVQELRQFCGAKRALMIPHHLAYPTGMRGVNWEVFDPECTPVVEIFSEHGNSEDDRGPFPFFNHSMGGRVTANTVRAALARGLQFGFVASTDSHSGFPGAYGEGLMAALCTDLDRASILAAINARRTYALTGDRIAVNLAVEGHPMGASIRCGRQAEMTYSIEGRDELDVVEVIQDGRVVHRTFPRAGVAATERADDPFQLRLEWGWGPWGDLALERIADWEFEIMVSGGRLLRHFPCLQSGPFDENRRHRFRQTDAQSLQVVSYSSRKGAYRQNPNQSVILEVAGNAGTRFDLQLRRPTECRFTATAGELAIGSAHCPTGPFPKESCLWHRLVPRAASRVEDRVTLDVPTDAPSHAYLRARQLNGHIAWTSPVFIDAA